MKSEKLIRDLGLTGQVQPRRERDPARDLEGALALAEDLHNRVMMLEAWLRQALHGAGR